MWSNLSLTSKNLAHRLIHFKVIHRAYITPYKRLKMKLQSNFNCHICNTASSGTFLHMFWECPIVISLWSHVNLVLSSLLRIDWSVNPSLCLLNDDSGASFIKCCAETILNCSKIISQKCVSAIQRKKRAHKNTCVRLSSRCDVYKSQMISKLCAADWCQISAL